LYPYIEPIPPPVSFQTFSKTNWLDPSKCGGSDTWNGVTLASDEVTKIDVKSNDLDGSLPSEIGLLTAISFLLTATNKLSGF